jgi:hypothetical protein
MGGPAAGGTAAVARGGHARLPRRERRVEVRETWVEGQKAFDREDPKDLLYAIGGYGAGHDQQPSFCCFGQ